MPYEIKKYQRTAERLAPSELKAVHPLGNAPVITDGTLNLAESGAIVGKLELYTVRTLRPSHRGNSLLARPLLEHIFLSVLVSMLAR